MSKEKGKRVAEFTVHHDGEKFFFCEIRMVTNYPSRTEFIGIGGGCRVDFEQCRLDRQNRKASNPDGPFTIDDVRDLLQRRIHDARTVEWKNVLVVRLNEFGGSYINGHQFDPSKGVESFGRFGRNRRQSEVSLEFTVELSQVATGVDGKLKHRDYESHGDSSYPGPPGACYIDDTDENREAIMQIVLGLQKLHGALEHLLHPEHIQQRLEDLPKGGLLALPSTELDTQKKGKKKNGGT